jgi:citrate lyase subunit beta/citryl-CoA lyase
MGPGATTARRRSCLSVPASSERKLAKASELDADEIVIDLEDAVPVAGKEAARAAALAALESWSGNAAVAVRVNPPRSPWCHLEVAALAGLRARPASIVLPKVESAGDIAFVERLLDGAEVAGGDGEPIAIQALIETAAGLANADRIAAASNRVVSLILGYADLAASLGGDRSLDAWLPAQHAVVVAARAAGLQAIDGPHLTIEPDDAFLAACRRARELGFDGKWAIHPAQVDPITDTFTPTADEVTSARALLDALEKSERRGDGAVELDGTMVDAALRVQALRVVALADDPAG